MKRVVPVVIGCLFIVLGVFHATWLPTVLRVVEGPSIRYPNNQTDVTRYRLVQDQFSELETHFVFISNDETPVFEKPDMAAYQLHTLPVSTRVRALFRMKGWVFVSDFDSDTVLGWVPDRAVAFRSDFKAVTSWYFGDFSFRKDAYEASFTVSDKGFFRCGWRARGNGLRLKGESPGRMYQAGDVIWAKKAEPTIWLDFFFLDEMEYLYPEIRINPERRAL